MSERPKILSYREVIQNEDALREKRFQEEVDAFQDRIGYQFQNRELLIQAFTHPGFANHFPGSVKSASNKPLETEGDIILRAQINKYTEKIKESSLLTAILNSNVYFSKRALPLELHRCVRENIANVQAQLSPEHKIRLTANALEAVVAAVGRDAGSHACEAFISRYILPNDALMQNILLLCSKNIDNVRKGFDEIVQGKAKLEIVVQHNWTTAQVSISEAGPAASLYSSTENSVEAAHLVVMKTLQSHPWILWGYGGEASVYMPNASSRAYGQPIKDQSEYHTKHPKVPKDWVATTSRTEEPYVPPPRWREADSWSTSDLPPIQSGSTSERGPYIDKLRISLQGEGKVLEVRSQREKSGTSFAFYIQGEFAMIAKSQKNINDAANQCMRYLRFVE